MADFGYDVADYADIDPMFGTLADFDRLLDAGARARAQGDPRFRAQPHLRPASLVPARAAPRATIRSATGTSGATRRRTAGRRTTGCRHFGGAAWEWDEATGQYYYHAFLQGAAGPQLAQSRGARGDARRAALLAGPRRRRLPRRRDLAPDQGRPVPRQPAQSRLRRGQRPDIDGCLPVYTRPTSPEVHEVDRRDARRGRRLRRSRPDRRDLPADRAAGRLLRPEICAARICRSISS